MNNEYYGAPSTPTEDFLAHYGIKGMKWGVRKAIERGSDRALRRQYKKASKKLAKLEKLGGKGSKFAKRAAAYGAGAALAGGVAATGTHGVGTAVQYGSKAVGSTLKSAGVAGRHLSEAMKKAGVRGAGKVAAVSAALNKAGVKTNLAGAQAGLAVKKWGKGKSTLAGKAADVFEDAVGRSGQYTNINRALRTATGKGSSEIAGAMRGASKSTLVRIGAAGVGAGLGVAAGRNAYRAATAKKHAAQAQEFRREMNKAFAGTKYANGMPSKKKRRK